MIRFFNNLTKENWSLIELEKLWRNGDINLENQELASNKKDSLKLSSFGIMEYDEFAKSLHELQVLFHLFLNLFHKYV